MNIDNAVKSVIKYWAETAAMSASLSALALAKNDLDEAMRLLEQAKLELKIAIQHRNAYKEGDYEESYLVL